MMQFNFFLKLLRESFRDLLPIVVVILFFQLAIIQSVPDGWVGTAIGLGIVGVGLAIFLQGLEIGIFPVGEGLAREFAKSGSTKWILIFGFLIGFGTTIAEPALAVIADKAASISSGRIIADHLRYVVALSVGFAILLGVFRIIKGHPIHYYIIVGYILVVSVTFFAPKEIIGLAYDLGGVTTSTVTVPLVAALGIGLASSIKGRNPVIDGFGLIAFASLTPMIFVQVYGAVVYGLVDAKDIFVSKRTKPLCNVPKILKGNYYAKSEGLLIEENDLETLIKNEPNSKKYIKKLIGSDEFINNRKRYCLWLVDCPPDELRKMPLVIERVNRVKADRLTSRDKAMQKLAMTPTLFRETNNPDSCLVIPVVSSERRNYIPMGFIDKNSIANNTGSVIENSNLFHFGILQSSMHMAWVKNTCGRLKSDFRYSNEIVYNNYPWPENPTEKQVQLIKEKAQNVLDVRASFPDSSLADLYNPLTMPPALVKAHNELDKAVDAAYSKQNFSTEAKRMEFLFELYEKYTADLFAKEKPKKTKKT